MKEGVGPRDRPAPRGGAADASLLFSPSLFFFCFFFFLV